MPPPKEESIDPATTELGVRAGKVRIGYAKSDASRTFKYGCKYCGRENVCSGTGHSCGRTTCNEQWAADNRGLAGVGKRIERMTGQNK